MCFKTFDEHMESNDQFSKVTKHKDYVLNFNTICVTRDCFVIKRYIGILPHFLRIKTEFKMSFNKVFLLVNLLYLC